MNLSELEVRRRRDDAVKYGHPADRNKGRVRMTATLAAQFAHGGPILPRMTRVVGLVPLAGCADGDTVFDLIVESPDISPPGGDGDLPLLELDVALHSLSKDRAASCMSIVEYAATAEWRGRPDTRAATALFGRTASGNRLLAEVDRKAPGDGDFSGALAAMKEVGWFGFDGPPLAANFVSWRGAVDSLDEDRARRMLAVMLESFWGRMPARAEG